MRLLIFGVLCASFFRLQAAEQKHWEEYLSIMHQYRTGVGLSGDFTKGEIELLEDPDKIAFALAKTGRDIGILYQDRYWIWVNDPVKFPNGTIGVYGRILARRSLQGAAGCAVLPRFKDGRIALNCNFRHTTRSWELEIPRGFTEENETPEESARREMQEETGLVAKDLILLGEMPPDTGKSSAVLAVFLGMVEDQFDATPQDSEAIASVIALTEKELCKGIQEGSLFLEINGVSRKVFLRDPFLTYALVQMGIRGLFSYPQ